MWPIFFWRTPINLQYDAKQVRKMQPYPPLGMLR
jgi:hypothetical protein